MVELRGRWRVYPDLLGFAELQKSGAGDDVGWVWLRHGEAELMLNTAYDEGERPPAPDPARRLPAMLPASDPLGVP